MSFLAAAGLTILFCSVNRRAGRVSPEFRPNRSGNDPGDWAADTLGGLLGAFVGRWLHRANWPREERRAD